MHHTWKCACSLARQFHLQQLITSKYLDENISGKKKANNLYIYYKEYLSMGAHACSLSTQEEAGWWELEIMCDTEDPISNNRW